MTYFDLLSQGYDVLRDYGKYYPGPQQRTLRIGRRLAVCAHFVLHTPVFRADGNHLSSLAIPRAVPDREPGDTAVLQQCPANPAPLDSAMTEGSDRFYPEASGIAAGSADGNRAEASQTGRADFSHCAVGIVGMRLPPFSRLKFNSTINEQGNRWFA